MRCLIKNIPPLTFGIAGNRGIGFPLTDVHGILPQILMDCFLIKEDGYTPIFTDNSDFVVVDCYDPDDVCIIVLQENRNYNLLQQEENQDRMYNLLQEDPNKDDKEQSVFFCSWAERSGPSYEELEGVYYLLMQQDVYLKLDVLDETANGDRILFPAPDPNPPCSSLVLVDGLTSVLVDQLWGDDLYIPCYDNTPAPWYVTMYGEDGSVVEFVDFVVPPPPLEQTYFISMQENYGAPLYDGSYTEDQIILKIDEDHEHHCYIAAQENADTALVDENIGDNIQFLCNLDAFNYGCDITLQENEFVSLLVPSFDQTMVLTVHCIE